MAGPDLLTVTVEDGVATDLHLDPFLANLRNDKTPILPVWCGPLNELDAKPQIRVVFGEPLPLQILTQPSSRTNNAGDTASFTIIASGATPLSYQWQRNGGNLTGRTDDMLNLGSVSLGDAGAYRVIVTNPVGAVIGGDKRFRSEDFAAAAAEVLAANGVPVHFCGGGVPTPVISFGVTERSALGAISRRVGRFSRTRPGIRRA